MMIGPGIAAPPGQAGPSLRERALAGPMREVREIVFANRGSYDDGHWYANIGYYCDDEQMKAYPANGKPDVGRLCKLDVRSGKVTVLLDARGGTVRDPVVHYDGRKVLFSWRKAGEDFFHLHEIGVDGSGLRQLTDGDFDDFEPEYLPDGGIAFISTRCRRWVSCWKTQVGTLYRCAADGSGIRSISSNIEHDNTPSVLPDGRILYTRWEYVDRSQIGYHHLWTIQPDGTGQMTFHGNQRHYPLFIGARAVPGTTLVAGIDAPGHGRRDHYGFITLFSEASGPDADSGIRRIPTKRPVTDPWPFAADCFLAARGKEIVVVDGAGRSEVLHVSPHMVFEPRPVLARPREPVPQPRGSGEGDTGHLILADVYHGRRMDGVARGDITKLLVLESLPKPVNFSGGPDLTSWLGTFNLERVLGTVPVEADGSASFRVPAHRPVFFVALDANDRSVKRMQSFTSVMPGETTSCVGCHESRATVGASPPLGLLQALERPPSEIAPFEGHPDVLDFLRDVQPVLDRHCVRCHSFEKYDGSLSLEGDLGPMYAHSWYALFARKLVADGRNGFGNQPPRTIGSSASRLLDLMEGGHYEVKVPEPEWRRVWMWIESAAPYAGTYAGLRNEHEMARQGWSGLVWGQNSKAIHQRCGTCHDGRQVPKVPFAIPEWPDTRGIKHPLARHERRVIDDDPLARFGRDIVLNLSRPEMSPLLLAPLAKDAGGWQTCGTVFADRRDPDYRKLLASLRKSKEEMNKPPRYGTPEWTPNRQYLREMKKFGVLPAHTKDRIDPFAVDQRYWQLLQREALGNSRL
jgi:hypothetical protein